MQKIKSLWYMAVIIALVLVLGDCYKYPEKYITTWRYQLENDIKSGDIKAIEYYNNTYIANGVELF